MTSRDRPYGGERASEDACTSARRTSAGAVFEWWRGIRAGECGLRASVSVDERATERGPESRAEPSRRQLPVPRRVHVCHPTAPQTNPRSTHVEPRAAHLSAHASERSRARPPTPRNGGE